MKTSMNENPIIEEIALLKRNSIQGLYNSKNAIQSFWSLKAKIELAIFQRKVSEISFQDQKEKQK